MTGSIKQRVGVAHDHATESLTTLDLASDGACISHCLIRHAARVASIMYRGWRVEDILGAETRLVSGVDG